MLKPVSTRQQRTTRETNAQIYVYILIKTGPKICFALINYHEVEIRNISGY